MTIIMIMMYYFSSLECKQSKLEFQASFNVKRRRVPEEQRRLTSTALRSRLHSRWNMPSKSRDSVKKRVTFSDDTTVTRTNNRKKSDFVATNPPVFVRKTLLTVPWHLLLLLGYYIKLSSNYDTLWLLFMLIPCQMAYLVYQFNKSTIYGKKRLKPNTSLLLVSIGGCFLLSFPAVVLVILFGAPFVHHLYRTWLLALQVSFLAYPAVYSVFNCDFKVGLWKKYFVAIVIGGWLSCVVIPLDWDRDWQAWPIPVVVGAYLGAFVGYSVCAYI